MAEAAELGTRLIEPASAKELAEDHEPLAQLFLELEQADPLEPTVRAGADHVYAWDDGDEAPLHLMRVSAGRVLTARVRLASGRHEAAERLLAQALAIDGADRNARTLLCRVKQAQGKLSEAMRALAPAPSAPLREKSALFELGRLHQESQHACEEDECRSSSEGPDGGVERDETQDEGTLEAGLVRAFRLAAAGQVDIATALCDRIMACHRGTDRGAYKLAAIEKAWLLESAGRVEQAIAWLEGLGREPDLAADFDRLVSLGRLHEGRAGGAAQAIVVYEHLLSRTRDLRLLGRLSRLSLLAGDPERARRYQERHLAAFEQDVGGVRIEQLLWVAVRHHVALADLDRFSFDASELRAKRIVLANKTTAGALRKRAILSLLLKERPSANKAFRELLARGAAGAVDLAYLSELTRRAGDLDMAGFCLGESMKRTAASDPRPDPLLLAGVLAEAGADGREASPIVQSLMRQSSGGRPFAELTELCRERRGDPVAWRALATVAAIEGRDGDRVRHVKRAEFLEKEGAGTAPPGHALTAAVYHAAGERTGIIHELWISRYPASGDGAGALVEGDVFANITDELRAYLRSVFFAAKKYARVKFGHLVHDADQYAYQFRLTNEDEPSSGPSAGLAIALAVVSLMLGRSLPADLAFSGMVVTEGRSFLSVRRVGDVDIKVHGALSGRLRHIVLPTDCRADMDASDLVPHEASDQTVLYVSDLDQAMEVAFGDEVWFW